MDVPYEIEALLRREGISQAALAKRASVSQPTVSRAKRRVPVRRSKGYEKLCSYIQQELKAIVLPGTARDALAEIWDGSPAHDEALAGLIMASGELRRANSEEGIDGQ
jgi:transcriptional regulator with XRE-family HTH domain